MSRFRSAAYSCSELFLEKWQSLLLALGFAVEVCPDEHIAYPDSTEVVNRYWRIRFVETGAAVTVGYSIHSCGVGNENEIHMVWQEDAVTPLAAAVERVILASGGSCYHHSFFGHRSIFRCRRETIDAIRRERCISKYPLTILQERRFSPADDAIAPLVYYDGVISDGKAQAEFFTGPVVDSHDTHLVHYIALGRQLARGLCLHRKYLGLLVEANDWLTHQRAVQLDWGQENRGEKGDEREE